MVKTYIQKEEAIREIRSYQRELATRLVYLRMAVSRQAGGGGRHVEGVPWVEVIGVVQGVRRPHGPQVSDGGMVVVMMVVRRGLRRMVSVPVTQRHRDAFGMNHRGRTAGEIEMDPRFQKKMSD